MTASPQSLSGNLRLLRNVAATLVTMSGAALIGALWFRELDGMALLDALAGSIYLFIGIGLYGQSRFTLFVAIAASAVSALYLSYVRDAPGILDQLRISADLIVIGCSAWVLWQVRKKPSV